MRLTLTDTMGKKVAEFEVVHQGPPDRYGKRKAQYADAEPHYELANEAAQKALAGAIAALVKRRHEGFAW